ncbi:soluble lamin-associated protein of 75 kDa [Onychomys torridus]|uniref:soluble lamin-associated protein of 75 kDa n=1 Tax=Onychomys torridus TaxID=38674 RepID=UPI00167F2E50|nr:soluble lamin-associated protein of 75 kDa [Onychomys torridus]XP_036063115.1 soluble lamin-associated protein of 75 kDa [Onychomys torridus]XP_036063116.1 soluble lamin-associated protein of 75 kDa [Onychomys torridus]XP_036063118.1 soluble lamin-associated protein of 75 kDa [Onychomys torridus]
MAFPVDLLDNCTHEELENSAEDYLSNLRCGDPENPECFSILNITVPISLSNVGFVPLYGGNQTQRVLALFAPEDSLTAVALYLVDQWWAIDDIVKTSEPSREGLKQVSTLGERVVLYVLNRVIYRKQEMERNEIPFLCHSSTDYAKILWKKGEAVGFYSVKPTGSLCASFLTQSYQLPVLDTMFIRKKYRGKDLGLHMLEDFVDSFTEEALGLRYPLSSLMYTASKQYFEKYPGDHELLWEVEGVGHWHQRTPVTRALQREAVKVTEISQYEARRPVSGEYGLATGLEYEPGVEESPSSEMQIHSLKDAFASTSEGPEKTPGSTRPRSSHLKRPKIGRRFQDSELSGSQGEEENSGQTSPSASADKTECTARTLESSEEHLQEELEQRVVELEDESSDKDAQSAMETQPRLEKQDGGKDSAVEPVNGEVVDDALKTSFVTEEEDSTSEGLEEELKVPSLNPSEETVNIVPLVVDSPKAPEAAPDKTSPVSDSEILADQGSSDDNGHTEEKLSLVSKKQTHLGSSDNVGTLPNEEKSDRGFPNSAVADFEEPVPENLSPKTTSSLEEQGEEGGPEAQETSAAQSSLIEVELEGVPFPQNAGQKNQSEEQSEASSEQLDQFTQSTEKAVDSSSEEVEVEVPVVDRRNLRRKAKGHKGPAKKKAKLS